MILVTGASGIVGAAIIKQLHKEKKAIRALKRSASDTTWTQDINSAIEWVEADILDIMGLDKAFDKVTHVIHCAAIVSFDNSNNNLMHTINVEGTKNLLTLSQKHNIQKFVFISSVAALGRNTKTQKITENTKWEESPLNTAYANSKYLAELEVWRAQEEGLPTVILNPSVIIGPGNWNSSSLKLFSHVRNKNPLYPKGTLNYVDVRDVAIIASKLLTNNIKEERFIVSAGAIPYKTFFELVAKAMNKRAPFLKVNTSLAMFAALILRIVRFVTGTKFNITKEAVQLSQLSILYSANKVENLLNHKFIPVEESIHWTCEKLENKSFNP